MRGIRIAAGTMVASLFLLLAAWAGQTAGRAKVLGIAYVKLKVTDVEKAKAFYGGLLGLQSGTARNGNGVQASFVVNPSQRVELVKTAAGSSGSYLAEIGFARILQSGPALAHRLGDGHNRLVLADDELVQFVLQFSRRCVSSLSSRVEGHAGHLADDLGDHLVIDHAVDLLGFLAPSAA